MVIYHYVERIREFSLPPIFCITYIIIKKYYPGELVNLRIRLLIILSRREIGSLPVKKGKGKLPLFFGNVEWVITFYEYVLGWITMYGLLREIEINSCGAGWYGRN